MVDESNVEESNVEESNVEESNVEESNVEGSSVESIDDITESEKFDVIYACLRCNTKVSSSELGRLPEIKCICGFRVFTKVRPPIVKTVKSL